jgi:cysteine desulfurase
VDSRYFDYAATTPVDPRVLREMLPFFGEAYGNADSLHAWGARARQAVELARERVAGLIGADDPAQIVFTSGATEANNWVLAAEGGGAIGPFEHASVLEPGIRFGYRVMENSGLDLRLPEPAGLASVMSVNNEIGARWDVRQFRGVASKLHADLAQEVGKLPVEVADLDYATLSAHKFYGPKGVGCLFAAEGPPPPIVFGGDHEHGFRAGTLNVPGIVGMGAAAAVAADEMRSDLEAAMEHREIVLEGLKPLSDWQVNGGENASPFILSLSFSGVEGETLVVELDRAGFGVSSGAACSSRSTEPSHVLRALGLPDAWLRGTIRISFGRKNDKAAARGLAKSLTTSVEKLRTMT